MTRTYLEVRVPSELDKMRDCPVLVTISVIGGKWRPRILWRLREGPAGFGDLHRSVGVSEKVLTDNLKALEREGIVSRVEVKVGRVNTTEYRYTDYGLSLVPVLDAMGQWGLDHGGRSVAE
jgi:DNA-binding HxlR family transcriptional regulator